MAQLPVAFDPNAHEPSQPRGDARLLPAAWYAAQIVGSEVKVTRADQPPAQQGRQLVLRFKVTEGPHAGAEFYEGLNIVNPNPKTVDIANRDLAAICQACGYTGQLADSEVLHGIQLDVKTKEEAPSRGYGPKVRCAGYAAYVAGNSRSAENIAAQQRQPQYAGWNSGQSAPAAVTPPPAAAGGSGAVAVPPVTPPPQPAQPTAPSAPPVAQAPQPQQPATQPLPAPNPGSAAPWVQQ